MNTQLLALRDALTALFDCSEAEASPAVLLTAGRACEAAFVAFGTPTAAHAADPTSRGLLQEVARLERMVNASLERNRDASREALRLVREAQRSTEFYMPESRMGRSCDVSG